MGLMQRSNDGPEHHRQQLWATGSLVGSGTTPPWHSSQLQARESALRSTLHRADNENVGKAGERPGREPHSTLEMPSQRVCSPVVASNLTLDQRDHRQLPVHEFTPINKRASLSSRPQHVGAVQPFTPVSSCGYNDGVSAFTPPRKLPIRDDNFEIFGRPLPNDFGVDFHEMGSFQAPQPRNSPAPELQMTETLQVDKEDGRVWHLGHELGESYSGVFLNDDPDDVPLQAKQMINAMMEKKNRPGRLRRSGELLRACRSHLESGATLALERSTFVEYGDSILCCRPGCSYGLSGGMPPNRYYLSLVSEHVEYEITFCLRCFERLWNLEFTEGIDDAPGLPHPDEARRDSAFAVPSYVGAADEWPLSKSNEIFKSIQASSEQVSEGTLSPVRTPDHCPETPDAKSLDYEPGHWSSPSSIVSTGEWRHPPTRFQHIAYAVRLGGTLSALDRAVVDLWKFASRAQLQWELHLRKAKCVREYYYYKTATEDLSLGMKPYRWEDGDGPSENASQQVLEKLARLRQRDCYGRDLSEVLKEAAQKKRD